MSEVITGAAFKKQLREGTPKMGLFLNAHSPTVAEQLAHSGYDWLLVDTQHGPMGNEKLSAMLAAVASGGAKSMVRVAGYHDRGGIQQALDLGADGVLVPTSTPRKKRARRSVAAAIRRKAPAPSTSPSAAPTRPACSAMWVTPTKTSSSPSRWKRLPASSTSTRLRR